VSCGQAHSSARQFVAQGREVKLVAETIGVSRSSLYYRSCGRTAGADRRLDGSIVEACGAKPAYGYRHVTWWMQRKQGRTVNCKRVLRVMRERGLNDREGYSQAEMVATRSNLQVPRLGSR
jgi:hypothetical protein